MTSLNDSFDSKAEIQRLKDDFEPHNLSKKICEAIKTQKDIDTSIKSILKEALENDICTQKIIKCLTKESLREEGKNIWIKIAGVIFSLVIAFISGGYFLK